MLMKEIFRIYYIIIKALSHINNYIKQILNITYVENELN